MAKLNQKTFLEDFSALNATEQKNALRELNVNLHQRITQMNGLEDLRDPHANYNVYTKTKLLGLNKVFNWDIWRKE